MFTPSNARYEIVNQLIVEPVEGDPDNLDGATLYQDAYKFDKNINRSYAPSYFSRDELKLDMVKLIIS